MFGKFPCTQCRQRYPYRQIVGDSHYICLDCYAWAKSVHERNAHKPLLERDPNILLGYYSGWAPWGYSKMLTTEQADHLLHVQHMASRTQLKYDHPVYLDETSPPIGCPIIYRGRNYRGRWSILCPFCNEMMIANQWHHCPPVNPPTGGSVIAQRPESGKYD